MNKTTTGVIRSALAAGLLLGCATDVFAKITGSSPIDAETYQHILARGMAASWYKNKFSTKGQGDDLKDFRARGFDHVRYRVNAEVFKGNAFDQIEVEIYRTIDEDLIPVISWINHSAESGASDADMRAYVAWWEDLAKRFKGQYLVGFNLFTEINDGTKIFTQGKYNPWMQAAVDAIRAVDPKRIIILSSPNKTHKQLPLIDPAIYRNDDYMMVEWHLYASGPKQDGGQKNWVGNGSAQDRRNLTDPLDEGVQFTKDTGIECYFGAWMPMDNAGGSLSQSEVENFAQFFVEECGKRGIPWTANADQHYYNSKDDKWHGVVKTTARQLDMPPIVDKFVNVREDLYGQGVDTIIGPPEDLPPVVEPSTILPDAIVGEPYTNSIAGSVSEPDGDVVTITASYGPAWLTVEADGLVHGTPSLSDVGGSEWGIIASDKDGSDTGTLSINVTTNPVVALVANAGADQTVTAGADGLAAVTLDASASQGNITLYRWKTNGVVLVDGEQASVRLPEGTHSVMLVVKDAVSVARDTVVITVEPGIVNEPPYFLSDEVKLSRARNGRDYSKSIADQAKDPDGDLLTFSKVDGPAWLSVAADGTVSGKPARSDKGLNYWTIKVEDGRGGSDTAQLKIRVR